MGLPYLALCLVRRAYLCQRLSLGMQLLQTVLLRICGRLYKASSPYLCCSKMGNRGVQWSNKNSPGGYKRRYAENKKFTTGACIVVMNRSYIPMHEDTPSDTRYPCTIAIWIMNGINTWWWGMRATPSQDCWIAGKGQRGQTWVLLRTPYLGRQAVATSVK